MQLTIYSFLTSWLFSSVILVTIHLLRKKREFVKNFGIWAMILLYAACLFRMVVTLEFPFTKALEFSWFLNSFYRAIYSEPVQVITYEIPLYVIFLALWFFVSAVLLAVFLFQYFQGLRRIDRYETNTSALGEEVFRKIQAEFPHKIKANVFICPKITSPMGIRLRKKRILLPTGDYTEQQLYYMVKHEYTHFYNRDLTVKFLVNLFCCLYWWNPAVYLLRKDISQMLEIKCDLTVTQFSGIEERKRYLSVILELLEDRRQGQNAIESPSAAQILEKKHGSLLVERFEMVLAPQKKKRWLPAGILAGFLILFLASYLVVIRPHYEPPREEMISADGTLDPSPSEGYILQRFDGTYLMVLPDQTYPLKKETAEVFASTGIEIREESE